MIFENGTPEQKDAAIKTAQKLADLLCLLDRIDPSELDTLAAVMAKQPTNGAEAQAMAADLLKQAELARKWKGEAAAQLMSPREIAKKFALFMLRRVSTQRFGEIGG
jgi:hypothetical protein